MFQASGVPKSVIVLTAIAMAICLPMIALSVVNYGMLSIWLNAAVAVLILVHHLSFLAATWVSNKRSGALIKTVIDPDDNGVPESDSDEEIIHEPISFHLANIGCLVFLFIINAIAFSIMVDITTRGALKSTLPAERIGSHKWNIKIQIGQTTVLGVQLLVLAINLAVCAIGWWRIQDQKEASDNAEYKWGES